jgi:Tfp pilus assembly protein PilF
VAAQIQLAKLTLVSGKPEQSAQYAQQAITTQPGNPDAHLLLARAMIARGDVVKAEQEIKPLLEKYPNSAIAYASMGALQLAKKDQVASRRAYERALQLDPNSLDALNGLLILDLAAKRPADAQARIDARLANTPSAAMLLMGARTYGATGDLSKAESLLKKAIEVDASMIEAYAALAQVYASQHKLAESRGEFEKFVKLQPKSVAAHTMIGMLYQMENKLPEAERKYEDALAIDQRAAVAANNLAWLLVDSDRDLDRALQLAQTAKTTMPTNGNVSDTLGWIYYKKEMTTQAVKTLEDAVNEEPKSALAHYHLGLAYARTAEYQKSRAALEEALRLDPKFQGADEARKQLAALAK